MNKEQHELLGEAYRNYGFTCIGETKRQEQQMKEKGGWLDLCLTPYFEDKEKFINKCKNDKDFSEKWGLKIEERELGLGERHDIKEQYGFDCRKLAKPSIKQLDDANIPTRLITITYNDTKLESYG